MRARPSSLVFLFVSVLPLSLGGCLFNPAGEGVLAIGERSHERRLSAFDGPSPSAFTVETLSTLGIDGDWSRRPEETFERLRRPVEPSPEIWRLRLAEAELRWMGAARRSRQDALNQSEWLAAALAAQEGYLAPQAGTTPELARALLLDLQRDALGRYVALAQLRFGHPRSWSAASSAEGGPVIRFESGPACIDPESFENLLVADDLELRGLRLRHGENGLGAPVVLESSNVDAEDHRRIRHHPRRLCRPATVLIREADAGALKLALVDPLSARVGEVMGELPLATDTSAHLVHSYIGERFQVSQYGKLIFPSESSEDDGFYLFEPYDPEKIPVIFLHGILSSPQTWTEAQNEILGDPILRTRFQAWNYYYPAGLTILDNAARLRSALADLQKELDPEGRGPASQNLVLVGHSMGGLLAKTLAMSSGEELRSLFLSRPIDALDVDASVKDRWRRILHFERLPEVRRIVFIATPHRGSPYSDGLIGGLTSRLVDTPDLYQAALRELRERDPGALAADDRVLAELDDALKAMRTGSAVLGALLRIGLPEDLPFHGILGQERPGEPIPQGTDGVVPYDSAHLEGAASEKVVDSGHSVQLDPLALLELRRILRRHLEESSAR